MTLRHLTSAAAALAALAAVTPAKGENPNAGITAATLFIEAPQAVVLIDSFPKLEMIEYFRAGSDHPTTTRIGSQAKIISLDDAAMEYEIGETASFQLATLPLRGGATCVALVETLSGGITDSDVTFFTSGWEPMDSRKMFPEPVLSDWLTAEGRKHRAALEQDIPFITARYTIDPAAGTLTARLTLSDYFVKEEWEKIAPLLKTELIYIWKPSGEFVLKK